MNNNQRRIRRDARKSGGDAFSVHPAYDKTCDEHHRPTAMSFTPRKVAFTRQPRLSHKAKVGNPTRKGVRQ